MRITSVNQHRMRSSETLSEGFARRAVWQLLGRIRIGCLVLEENGQVHHFGEARAEATLVAQVSVRHSAAWSRTLRGGSLAAGEAYMQGEWDSPDLLSVVRLMVLNMQVLKEMESRQSGWRRLAGRIFHRLRRNSRRRARENIAAHYDLSNDFFSLFLDPSMAYSAGIYYQEDDTLAQASHNKFEHICRRLQLSADDHLLEVGTGWGGLAIHAARHYGCRVTTTTLSREQYDYACEQVRRAGLEERVTLLLKDYRELEGRYDKLVSVEMIEAVGADYYAEYFSTLNRLLKPEGLMLIQAITISDQRYEASVRRIDFIKRYIFPGGQLPCNSVITGYLARHTDMQLIGLEDITRDYALTLRAWRENFWQHIDAVRDQGADETFIRMWHYYLCFCEGGFMERAIHTAQFLAAGPGFRALPSLQAPASGVSAVR